MSAVEYRGTIEDGDARSVRDALALALDGVAVTEQRSIEQAYRVASLRGGERLDRLRERMQQLGSERVVAVGRPIDLVPQLLSTIRIDATNVLTVDDIDGMPAVVILGCVSPTTMNGAWRIAELLAGGAVLVTSDKSAGLPVISDALRPGGPQPPRRTRLDLNAAACHAADVAAMLGGFTPVVRLSPGYVPIAPDFSIDSDAWILGSDLIDGAPIGVAMKVSNGYIVHAVSHWWQADNVSTTELERRLVSDVPGLRDIVPAGSPVTFGQLSAATAMLAMLVSGLLLTLDRVELCRAKGDPRR
jgi:hypothetical protein